MSYVNDFAAVREAKENVESTLFDMQVGKLDDEIDDLNTQLEEIDTKYDKLIEDTEKFYDTQIEGIQNLIDMWEKLQHQAELVEAYTALNNFGITAQDILSGDMETFNLIRDGYIGVFAGLSEDINAVASAFEVTTTQANMFKDALLGYDEATKKFSEMDAKLKDVGWAAQEAAKLIGDDNDYQTPTGGISMVGSMNTLNDATAVTTKAGIDGFKEWYDSADKLNTQLVTLSTTIKNMPTVSGVTTALTTASGASPYSGSAYADGNWTAGSKGISGKSLVGELGPEVRVRNGQFTVLGKSGAEFTDVRKDDIIFNSAQSKALLKNGKINSRGKAYASGNNNKFTALSSEELSRYNKLDFTKDLAEKLDFGNQKLMNIDKTVSTICNTKTVNNSPVFNIDNTFTCNGVSLADIQNELAKSFQGIFEAAYQKAMTK